MKRWPREQLPYILNAAADVAADQVSIALLELGGRHNASCEHALSQAVLGAASSEQQALRKGRGRRQTGFAPDRGPNGMRGGQTERARPDGAAA